MTPMFLPVTYGPEGETRYCRTDNVSSITTLGDEIQLHDKFGGAMNVHPDFNPRWAFLLDPNVEQQH